MRQMVEKILTQYGTDMVLQSGGSTNPIRGFLQAVNSSGWQSLESEATLLGEISRGQYTFIGPVGSGVREGDTLMLGEKSYLLRRVEPYYYRNQPIYLWGLCVERGVNDTWGSPS
jgi:hypothetical protein